MMLVYVMLLVSLYYKQNVAIVTLMIAYLITYQGTTGTIKFVHFYETCVDSAVSTASGMGMLGSVINIFTSQFVLLKFNITGMFIYSLIWTFLGFLYITFIWKDTTFKYERVEDPILGHIHRKMMLTDKDKKELYMP